MLLMAAGTQRNSVQLLSLTHTQIHTHTHTHVYTHPPTHTHAHTHTHTHTQLCSGCSFGQLLSYIGQIISVHACYVGKP